MTGAQDEADHPQTEESQDSQNERVLVDIDWAREQAHRIGVAAARAAFDAAVAEFERSFDIRLDLQDVEIELPLPREIKSSARGVVPSALLEDERFLGAVMDHNISVVYKMLQVRGVSQRRIAALTEQSQSEVSEILNGRVVQSYAVLYRIFRGLGIPLWWAGFGHVAPPTKKPR